MLELFLRPLDDLDKERDHRIQVQCRIGINGCSGAMMKRDFYNYNNMQIKHEKNIIINAN